jgi:endoglucanase
VNGRAGRPPCTVVLLAVALVLVAPAGSARAAMPHVPARVHAAATDEFFDRFVTGDGRVVRTDQGGDTVSEGQAYALLLAVADRDRGAFARVWRWTAEHLQRPDGLLAWHWADGQVVDAMAATDADLDAARALALAASVFDEQSWRDAATRLAAAVLAEETVASARGPLLVAGPWAQRDPAVVNPSYFSPRAADLLATTTGDARWRDVDAASDAAVDALTRTSLPPDWATIDAAGAVHASPAPDGAPAGYGQDAARMALRYAESCAADDRERVAALWPRLRYSPHRSPLGAVAAAAAADAAGDRRARDTLLHRADVAEASSPTYYGAAWVALARVMLTTHRLGTCPSPYASAHRDTRR